jgi:hypothetical protein
MQSGDNGNLYMHVQGSLSGAYYQKKSMFALPYKTVL